MPRCSLLTGPALTRRSIPCKPARLGDLGERQPGSHGAGGCRVLLVGTGGFNGEASEGS